MSAPPILVVIEAPGKRKMIGALLKSLGKEASVLATIGHLGANPGMNHPEFGRSGIGTDFRELAYRLRPDRERVATEIREAAAAAKVVYLATDDDQEGDVIARDVVRFCMSEDDARKAQRVRLRSLAPSEFGQAFEHAMPFDPMSACRGDARRIMDRLIGALSSEKAPVGRVQGSLLLELSRQRPVVGTMTYVAPCADGGAPWTATCPVFAGERPVTDYRVDVPLRAGAQQPTTYAKHGLNHDDILLTTSLRTGASLADVSSAMQGLYERGAMTYPRTKSREIARDSARRLMATAKFNGVGFNPNLFKAIKSSMSGEHAHEAPNSMMIDVPVNRDDVFLNTEEAVLVGITRNLLSCGLLCQLESPTPESIQSLPPEVSSLNWQRVQAISHFGWQRDVTMPGFSSWSKEQSLLHFASTNGLGRPSTIMAHIEKFLPRETVTETFDLTEKGAKWCNHIGELFGHQNISQIIENFISMTRADPAHMVGEMVKLCGLTDPIDAVVSGKTHSSEHDHEEFEI